MRAKACVPLMHEVRRFCDRVLLHGDLICLFLPLSSLQAQCCIDVRVALCFYVIPQ